MSPLPQEGMGPVLGFQVGIACHLSGIIESTGFALVAAEGSQIGHLPVGVQKAMKFFVTWHP